MDSFNEQLIGNYDNNNKILYKANNVSSALDVLLRQGRINRTTLIMFDLDGTLFETNADDINREDRLLPEIRDSFIPIYRQLRNITRYTGIITGRSETKRPITLHSLRHIGLEFETDMVYFTNRSKSIILEQVLNRLSEITNIIYFDDYMLHNGVCGTILPLIRMPNRKFIGVKVGNASEIIFDVEEQFNENNTANLVINGDKIESRIVTPIRNVVPQMIPRPIPATSHSIEPLRSPLLDNMFRTDYDKTTLFFHPGEWYEIIKPIETITIKFGDIIRSRIPLSEIKIDKLSNNKYVIQQMSIISCGNTSFAMLLIDNGVSLYDEKLHRLLIKNIAGGFMTGTTCERLDEYYKNINLSNKYLLHDSFHSINLKYDVKYFQILIERYGSLLINVNFNNKSEGGHYVLLDSIDNDYVIIREPYHGYAFKFQTNLLLTKKMEKTNNKYRVDFLSTQKHTGAFTQEEEDIRVAELLAKNKYLKYKTKYLNLKTIKLIV